MKKNMGLVDRSIRLVIVAIIAAFYFFDVVHGAFGIALLVVAGVFALTSIISFCPLYALLGIRTCTRNS